MRQRGGSGAGPDHIEGFVAGKADSHSLAIEPDIAHDERAQPFGGEIRTRTLARHGLLLIGTVVKSVRRHHASPHFEVQMTRRPDYCNYPRGAVKRVTFQPQIVAAWRRPDRKSVV